MGGPLYVVNKDSESVRRSDDFTVRALRAENPDICGGSFRFPDLTSGTVNYRSDNTDNFETTVTYTLDGGESMI
jgi:hypothetical protein